MINIVIVLSVACSAVAQLVLKKGMSNHNVEFVFRSDTLVPLVKSLIFNGFIVLGVSLHIIALLTWLYVLKHVDVSYAYPFISLGFVLVLVLGSVLFHESVDLFRIAGVGFIIIGVLLVSRSANW